MSQPLAAAINPDRDLQRGLDLLVLDAMRIQAWERLLFLQCGAGWIVEEAWRRALRVYACGLDTSPALVARSRMEYGRGAWWRCARGTARRASPGAGPDSADRQRRGLRSARACRVYRAPRLTPAAHSQAAGHLDASGHPGLDRARQPEHDR